jgi:hypothetical protein
MAVLGFLVMACRYVYFQAESVNDPMGFMFFIGYCCGITKNGIRLIRYYDF